MTSLSPINEEFFFDLDVDAERSRIVDFVSNGRQNVIVQGLGFVGVAMVAALSQAHDDPGNPLYNVVGVDRGDEENYWKIAMVNDGRSPVASSDVLIAEALRKGRERNNVLATYAEYAYQVADIVIVDVNLDIQKMNLGNSYDYRFSYDAYLAAMRQIAENIREGTLVIIESTVPPGTTQKILLPFFEDIFHKRGLDASSVLLAHSYERVTPGRNYLNSVVNFYRVYSGINERSKMAARRFLESFINTLDYPLHEVKTPTASEMAKVLENSYRALNIAFIQEWSEFAEICGVDLFEVIEAVKRRPTHNNIMRPGFGVGGYCLPKDALLADWAYNTLFSAGSRLRMSLDAIAVNDFMPRHTFNLLKSRLSNLAGLNVTILGVSYLPDVSDTRASPTSLLYDLLKQEGSNVVLHDPIVKYWQEKGLTIYDELASLKAFSHSAAVFTVKHNDYERLSAQEILSLLPDVRLIIDANDVISDEKAVVLRARGVEVLGVGKGHWANGREKDE